jgi:elongation factor G
MERFACLFRCQPQAPHVSRNAYQVIGGLEPLSESTEEMQEGFEFENRAIGNNIPGNFIPAIEKGFKEACEEGPLIGHPVSGLRAYITDGAAHSVDSNELAFKLAAKGAFRQVMAAMAIMQWRWRRLC